MKQTILSSTFIRFRDKLHNVAAGIVGNSDDADDVIHDAFCRLWSKHGDIADELSAIKLSYTAVRNSAIDTLRRSKSSISVPIESLPEANELETDDDEAARREATYRAVLKLSREVLSHTQYEVFRRHDVEGMPYQEIAAELEMTPEYVRVTLSRARKTIREIYRKQHASE
ncbi:MAG: sigma-70 family RNA polymerase sigma factor [Muribaculaceae bacterium]|nr:sigma-70 family RNA polymerase sigma factor [Muribaculaceae bacterium]